MDSSKLSDSMNLSRILPYSPFRSFDSIGLSLILPAVLMAALTAPALSQGTRLWTQSRFEEFEKGTPQGIQISNDGKLRTGPMAREILTTPSSFVWSVASDRAGNGVIFLGTGSPATVLRVTKDSEGKPQSTKLFETKALAVQVVRVGPDGAVYAATIPDGKVFRLKPDAATTVDESTAEVVFDLGKAETEATPAKADEPDAAKADASTTESKKPDGKARYIWDMTFGHDGNLYVATGGPAAIYKVNVSQASATEELFFKSDEQHIRTITWDKAGNLIAGTDGSGLVYRISPEGKGYVLFSAPRREVTAVAVGADGTIYEADVGDKSHNPLPQLPVQNGNASITITFVQPGSLQAANASTALPEGTEIYAIMPDQAPRKIWSDKDAIVYQLAASQDGVTALTGNRGRIFTIRKNGSWSDVAHLDAQQAVAMIAMPMGLLVGTANTGKLFALAEENGSANAGIRRYASYPEEHSYASDVLDAGALARWGRVEADPDSHGYQIWTRSGNVEQPVRRDKDWGWSDWQPAANDKIASPPGRYLQWKVVLGESGEISGVGVNYLPVNSAPAVDDVVVVTGARVTVQPQQMGQAATVNIAFPNAAANAGAVFDGNSANAPIQAQKDRTAVTARWAAHDDDSDDLTYDLYLRGDGEHNWLPLKKGLTDKVYSFDATEFPDGGYKLKVVASDAPSHSPGEALTAEIVSERFELDTTPPVISGLKVGAAVPGDCKQSPCARNLSIPVSFDARDAISAISHAEYSLDAGPWQYIEPVGELSDSKEEHYYVLAPLPAALDGKTDSEAQQEHLITVRAYDRHENMATAKVIVPAGGQKQD